MIYIYIYDFFLKTGEERSKNLKQRSLYFVLANVCIFGSIGWDQRFTNYDQAYMGWWEFHRAVDSH